MSLLAFANKQIDLSEPRVMAVLNMTPDSFSDGGQFVSSQKIDTSSALKCAEQMVEAGASFIDIGGESTRPGAQEVSVQEEMDRVLPIVEAIAKNLDVVVSVDTSSADVMRESVKRGAGLLNDVRALLRPGALQAAVDANVPVCLMHMQGMPETMQENPRYEDVVAEVKNFLEQRKSECVAAGIAPHNILVDPGFGFGKKDNHNIALLQHLDEFNTLGPILVGLSRKSMIGRLLNREVNQRLAGSLALAMLAADNGASIVRVHDVQETSDVLTLLKIIKSSTSSN